MQTNFKIPSKLVKRAPQLSVIFLITPCCLTGTLGDFFLHAVGVFFCSRGDFFRLVIFSGVIFSAWWFFPGWFFPWGDFFQGDFFREVICSVVIFSGVIFTDCHLPSKLAVPHRSVTRFPSRPELEAMSRPPLEQAAWLTPQGQQCTSCWPLETGHHTVLADYALMTLMPSALMLFFGWQ